MNSKITEISLLGYQWVEERILGQVAQAGTGLVWAVKASLIKAVCS